VVDRSDDDLVTAKVLAKHMDVKDRTLRDMVRAGEFPPPIRMGGVARWRWGTFLRWVEAVELVQRLSPGLLGARQKVVEKRQEVVEQRQSTTEGGKPGSGQTKPR
jgi:predicted DNA-binding transcriptional regulator AlpA